MTARSPVLNAIAALFAGCVACNACTPAPGPIDAAPTPPAPTVDPPNVTAIVCGELVEGGCLQTSDAEDVCVSVYAESTSDASPGWLTCLYQGGTVKSCGVPCGDP